MHEDNQLNPVERELEAALRQLRPAGHGIDRDQLMFAAGQRAARRTHHRWQAATAVLTALLAASWTLQLALPTPPQVAEVPPVEDASLDVAAADLPALPEIPDHLAAVPPEIWPPVPKYIRLRNRMMEDGLDALQGMQIASAAVGPGDSLDEDLDGILPTQEFPGTLGTDGGLGG